MRISAHLYGASALVTRLNGVIEPESLMSLVRRTTAAATLVMNQKKWNGASDGT
jgi:hypothetical protein